MVTDEQIKDAVDFWALRLKGTEVEVDKFRKMLKRVIEKRKETLIVIAMNVSPESTLTEALKLAGLEQDAIPEQRTQILFKDDGSVGVWSNGKWQT